MNHQLDNQKIVYKLIEGQLIGSNNILALELGIKKDSLFNLNKKYLLQKNILIFAIDSSLISAD